MRILDYIFILCVVLLSFGCTNEDIISEGDDNNIILPDGGPYIYLDAMVDNKTRVGLVEGNELQDGFGAYGFTYDFTNRWSTYRITATPNVFKNDGDDPQEVTYSEGIYSYEPVQTWQGGKYTFFAYYPYGNASVTPSGLSVQGTPYVTYAPENFLTSTDNHADVMTAMFQDTSLSSSQYVGFDFEHRLSAIEVVALNFYEHNSEDDGGNVTSEKIKIKITDLKIAFTNLDYMAAKIYLDSSIPSECTTADGEPSYDILTGDLKEKEIVYNTTSEFQRINAKQTLLVIPQTDDDLEVTTTVTFKKIYPDGSYLNEVPKVEGITFVQDNENGWTYTSTKTTPFGQALKTGSRYYIQITFTSAAVSINILTSAEWEDLAEDIYHEFE